MTVDMYYFLQQCRVQFVQCHRGGRYENGPIVSTNRIDSIFRYRVQLQNSTNGGPGTGHGMRHVMRNGYRDEIPSRQWFPYDTTVTTRRGGVGQSRSYDNGR